MKKMTTFIILDANNTSFYLCFATSIDWKHRSDLFILLATLAGVTKDAVSFNLPPDHPLQASPHNCFWDRIVLHFHNPWLYLPNTLPFKNMHAWMPFFNELYAKTKAKINPWRSWNTGCFLFLTWATVKAVMKLSIKYLEYLEYHEQWLPTIQQLLRNLKSFFHTWQILAQNFWVA